MCRSRKMFGGVCNLWILSVFLFMVALSVNAGAADLSNGLLFYLSGENGVTADVAADAEPNYLRDVEVVSGGKKGDFFQCGNSQLFAYDAPGNIYAQRGTLSFFWRGRLPVGETPFPIFRVGYADHSSWDLVWLRIDWNGEGFEGFVTDINLARPRLKAPMETPPDPDQWVHLAITWDETVGTRLYVDGRLAAHHDTSAVFDAGLDQFGPHSRIISPYQVQSLYNYVRGGDIDELCIYDHMLDDGAIAGLSNGDDPRLLDTVPVSRTMTDGRFRDEWLLRYGWNRAGDPPPYLASSATSVRKLGFTDVYDVKQWIWKGSDGIRETTWPYVYNMSRLIGRPDYFMIPDWNCYSMSGTTVRFSLPDEPWNHVEISGSAYGTISHLALDPEKNDTVSTRLGERPKGQERTVNRLAEHRTGGTVLFTNDVPENPIGEFMVYNVEPGKEPVGTLALGYTLRSDVAPDNESLADLRGFIDGRYPPDERQMVVATPRGAPVTKKTETVRNPMPIVHALIPFDFRKGKQGGIYTRFSYTWENLRDGLDGIAIDLPALDAAPLTDGLIPLNVRIMDPVWPARVLCDFSFSVKPGEARTLWLDTRDRILPNGYSLYMTFASGSSDFDADDLNGAGLRLIFTDREKARKEHEHDRFTQIRDNLGNMVEEYPNSKKLRMYARFSEDATDLLRVNPDHEQGRIYWRHMNKEQGWPPFDQPEPPAGVPLWAFRQIENLRLCEHIYNWWIDERQIENGEFGGGLSDDGDMTNQFPGPALMGITPDKYRDSLHRLMDAYYDQGLFTNGLSTITTDELHTYEEGINVLPQLMLADYGDPETVERMVATAAAYDRITGINDKGYRQIKSIFFGGKEVFSEGVWAKSRPYSSLILHPGLSLVEFNGHPATKKLIIEVADGILSTRHKRADGSYSTTAEILYPSGEGVGSSLGSGVYVLWAAYRWTGDRKYLAPLTDGGSSIISRLNANLIDHIGKRDTWGADIARATTPFRGSDLNRHIAWQVTGNRQYLEEYLGDQLQVNTQMLYMNTDGHWWIDRIYAQHRELQRERLGGIALWRNMLYPGHYLGWEFEKPATYESVAILVPDATPEHMTVMAYNVEDVPVTVQMTGWDVEPGQWEMIQGIDTDGDGRADAGVEKRRVTFERSKSVDVTFPPKKETVLSLRLKKKGTPYWKRPDLGISKKDVVVKKDRVQITVHSLGSVPTKPAMLFLVGPDGKQLSGVEIPSLEALQGYDTRTKTVMVALSPDVDPASCSIVIDPDGLIEEITRLNNTVALQ